MDITTPRVSIAPIRWRPIAVLLVLAALILATLIAVNVGSQRRLPAPYGPAGNGLIAYAAEGDIYLGDPATGTSRSIISGPDIDTNPVFSNDGTQLFFMRGHAGGYDFLIANADGSHARVITPEPIRGATGGDWSPDGRLIVVATDWGGAKKISIVDVERGTTRTLEVSGFAGYDPVFRPPAGVEIAFTYGEYSGADMYVVGIDGRQLRHLGVGAGARYSPDGSRIAYGRSYPDVDGNETRVMDADGSNDHIVGDRPDIKYQGTPVWSPDGTKLIVFRNSTTVGEVLAAVPADGSGPGEEFRVNFTGGFGDLGWSPDGRQIVSTPADGGLATLVDLVDGDRRVVPSWYISSWQRVAP